MTTHLPARRTRAYLSHRPPRDLAIGEEWWVDNRHALAGRLQSDRSVRELARYDLGYGLHGALVYRRRPRPSRARRVALWAAATFVALTGAGIAVWALLRALAPLLAAVVPAVCVLLGLYGLVKILTGHRVTCPGLHCPGCRH